MPRTYVVTGAASGIGAATADLLSRSGGRVIRCDLHGADISADLGTAAGRAEMCRAVEEWSGGVVDGIAAVAGIGRPEESTVCVNYFGALATLEGLRPALARSTAPRAVAVSSLASVMAADEAIVEACLAGDEDAALAAAGQAVAARKGRLIYASTKQALNRWVRRTAPSVQWAGAGIPLNAVAPGVIDTPGAQDAVLGDAAVRVAVETAMPQPLGFPGEASAVAALLGWTLSEANGFMTGQVLFIDGGAEALLRGDTPESAVRYSPTAGLRVLRRYAAARLRQARPTRLR